VFSQFLSFFKGMEEILFMRHELYHIYYYNISTLIQETYNFKVLIIFVKR